MQLQPQQERAEEEPQEQQQGQILSQQTPEDAEQQRLQQVRVEESRPHQERLERESHLQQQVQLQTQQERVEEDSQPQQERVAQESRSQQRVQLQPQQEGAEEEPEEQQQGRAVSQESHWSRYRADGPFHLVLCSRVPPHSVLPRPLELSLTVLHDPLFDYLRASLPVVSRVLSALVTHPTAPLSSVSALVTTVAGFASSHSLDYAAHLVSGPARSPSSGGAPVFPLEVLEDR
ncbi:unnamed protein product [Closterium sp. NIES-54]